MAIEKMMYVNVVGFKDQLEETINRCIESGSFHIEDAEKIIEEDKEISALFSNPDDDNPYRELLKKVTSIHFGSGYHLHQTKVSAKTAAMSLKEMEEEIDIVAGQLEETNATLANARQMHQEDNYTRELIEHLSDMKVNFSDLFSMKNIHIRFGKLPIESFNKLSYYRDEIFQFIPYSSDKTYYWGVYFVPSGQTEKVDKIFESLYFERVRISRDLKDEPENEYRRLTQNIERTKDIIQGITGNRADYNSRHFDLINQIFCHLKMLYESYILRQKAVMLKGMFYLVGFVPLAEVGKLQKKLQDLKTVEVIIRKPQSGDTFTPPTKLKNNKFSSPFAMFVEMYGLPAYNEFNPTNFVAITYTLIFGIMFGDLGQGLFLSLAGFLLYLKTKNMLAAIVARIGLSSAFFGYIFGSFFGFEGHHNPLHDLIYPSSLKLPFEVMQNANLVLGSAIGLGVVIIVITMLFNIIFKMKQRNYEAAVFGPNGVVGLVFFVSLLAGFLIPMVTDIKLMTPVYVICLIILPVLMMFMREPLSAWMSGKKFHMHGGIGDFIVVNFFELFEFMLSYATNTISFVRIGGFVFSHAGMMSVVMLLAGAEAGGANPIVVVIGNIFVIVMEGLIAGIQVMRLEFYEMFSRFYDGNGRSFTPIKVKYDTAMD